MAARTFAEQLDRDAGEVFLAGPASGFAVPVVNGAVTTQGILDTRYMTVDEGGVQSQQKRTVLRLKTGTGGTIDIDTRLIIGGTTYRVDAIAPVEPDGRFTDYGLAGGSA